MAGKLRYERAKVFVENGAILGEKGLTTGVYFLITDYADYAEKVKRCREILPSAWGWLTPLKKVLRLDSTSSPQVRSGCSWTTSSSLGRIYPPDVWRTCPPKFLTKADWEIMAG
jgi:hypothetical protein